MSSFSRRPSGAGSTRSPGVLIRWLTGSVLAGSSLAVAHPYRTSQPYLAALAPLPLRFAPPPPDISTDPAPAAPPNPDGVIGDVVQSNHEAVVPAPLPEPTPAEASIAPELESTSSTTPAAESSLTTHRAPVEIIPDDLSREVRPEDILPFFLPPQLPSGPQSKATYRLK